MSPPADAALTQQSAAVYTDRLTATHVIRRVMPRIETRMHYVF